MKKVIVTQVCDMPHTAPTEAEHVVVVKITNAGLRAARTIDLCNVCAKKYVEPLYKHGELVKRQ